MIFETTEPFEWPESNPAKISDIAKAAEADAKAQGLRIDSAMRVSGYRHPDVNHANYMNDPIVHWTGSGSKKITALSLDLAKGMSVRAAIDKHGADTMKMHQRLLNELEKAPKLSENVHVFSGTSEEHGEHLGSIGERQVYDTLAPISATLHPAIAYRRGLAGHVINIFMREGSSPGLYIGGNRNTAFHHDGNVPEYEMIIKPRRRLLLIGRTKSKTPANAPLTIHNFVDVTEK